MEQEKEKKVSIPIDQSHETGVMAMKDGKVIYFRSFHYPTQQDEAQAAFKYAESLGGGFYMFHLGSRWTISNNEESYQFQTPMP